MDEKIIKYDDTEVEEYKCHQYKSPIFINDIGYNKIVVVSINTLPTNEYTLKKVFTKLNILFSDKIWGFHLQKYKKSFLLRKHN